MLSASREEPPLVSYAEVSLSLWALNTHKRFLRAGLGAEQRGGWSPRRAARRSHPAPPPPPAQSPGRVRDTLPAGAPGPSVSASPPAVPGVRPAPLGAQRGPPAGYTPLSHQAGEDGGNRASASESWAQGNLQILKKRAAGEGRSGPRGGKAGHLWGDRGRAGGGRGAATSPPLPAPGPRRRRQLHTQKPIVTAPDAQPRGLGPAAKRVSGPVSRAGLLDARAARAINSRSPGGPGGFPVTPGPAWEEEGAGDNEAAAASPAPPSPRRPARAAREWEGPSRARALPSRWDPRGSEPLGLR